MADQWTCRVSIRCQNANWYVRHMVVVAGPLCLRSCFDGPTEPFLCDIIGSIIDQWVPFLDPSSFIILFFLSAAQKKSLVFGVKILLSANVFAWLHISDNMIGLQEFHYGANFLLLVRLPMYALVTFSYLWNGCVLGVQGNNGFGQCFCSLEEVYLDQIKWKAGQHESNLALV